MKIAVLGLDENVLGFLHRNRIDGQHEVAVAVVLDDEVEKVREVSPRVDTDWTWEALIGATEIDAVVVARGSDSELHDDQLRKLAQSGTSLMISHPSCSAVMAYELDMIAADTGGGIAPLFLGQSHGVLAALGETLKNEDGPLGSVQRIEFERQPPDSLDETIVRLITLDAALVSQVMGPISSVSAIGSRHEHAGLAGITVHLMGQGSCETRWSVTPSGGTRMRAVGTLGTATLLLGDEPAAWRVETDGVVIPEVPRAGWDPPGSILDHLADPSRSAWQSACRDLEIAETALESLRRKRMLEVYGEPPTEEDSFKGFMAMGSCLLLLIVLFVFCALAVVEGIRLAATDPTDSAELERWPLLWRLWPVYPLLAFLGLQLLLVVARKPARVNADKI